MWQGKLVITKPKNSTKRLFWLPLFSYLLLYIIIGKTDIKEIPTEIKEHILSIPSLSRNNKIIPGNIERRLPGTSRAVTKQALQELWIPCCTGNQGTIIPQDHLQTSGRIKSETWQKERRTPKRLYRIKPPACAEIDIKFTDNFGASSESFGHRKSKGNPQ